jgi:hypothetical protein
VYFGWILVGLINYLFSGELLPMKNIIISEMNEVMDILQAPSVQASTPVPQLEVTSSDSIVRSNTLSIC